MACVTAGEIEIDLETGERLHRTRQVRRETGGVLDARAARKIDTGDGERRGVRVGRRNRGAEGERARTGTTDIGGGIAVVELQCGRARDGHGLAEAERQCDGIADMLDSCPRVKRWPGSLSARRLAGWLATWARRPHPASRSPSTQ